MMVVVFCVHLYNEIPINSKYLIQDEYTKFESAQDRKFGESL